MNTDVSTCVQIISSIQITAEPEIWMYTTVSHFWLAPSDVVLQEDYLVLDAKIDFDSRSELCSWNSTAFRASTSQIKRPQAATQVLWLHEMSVSWSNRLKRWRLNLLISRTVMGLEGNSFRTLYLGTQNITKTLSLLLNESTSDPELCGADWRCALPPPRSSSLLPAPPPRLPYHLFYDHSRTKFMSRLELL